MIHGHMILTKLDMTHRRTGSRILLNRAYNTPNARLIPFDVLLDVLQIEGNN